MKSNEEYLDELLKSMSEPPGSNTAEVPDMFQEEFMEEAAEAETPYENEFEDEADFMAKLLQAEDINDLDLEPKMQAENAENGLNTEADMAEIEKALEELAGEEEQNTFSKLEDYTSGMDVAEEEGFSEDDIEALLNAAQSEEPEAEPISFNPEDEADLAEIEALLEMSDNGEIVDESSFFSDAEDGLKEEIPDLGAESEEVQELDMDELDALLSLNEKNGESAENEASDNTGKEDKKADKKAGKKADKKAAKEKKPEKEKKTKQNGKGGGLFSKIFSALVEEIPEEDSDKGALNLTQENKEILEQIDKEDSKIKVKDKKEKKEKKKKEKPPKEKKPPKAKKPKKVKEPKEAIPNIPEKKIPRKKVTVTFIFGFSVLAAILLIETLMPPLLSVNRARVAYDRADYAQAYREYYGLELSEEDEKQFQAATAIMQMQSNLDGYNSFTKIGKEIYALHSLLEGVRVKNTVLLKAEEYGVPEIVLGIYNEILTILSEKYQLTEEDAAAIIGERSNVSYTKKLQSVIGN